MKCSLSRLVGAAVVNFACSGCMVTIDYTSSGMCGTIQRHTTVSVALRLAAFLSGMGFRGYHKLLKRYLGIHAVTNKHFSHVIEMAYPHIKDILDGMCDLAKADMKSLPSSELGSWKRAVTTSDGCWHIRGFFSQNSTFIIRNYLTGSLLYYGHASMRGVIRLSVMISIRGLPSQLRATWQEYSSNRQKTRAATSRSIGRTRTFLQKSRFMQCSVLRPVLV